MIKNLDTGEEIPLSLAEEKLPTGINPLTLHIMRRTKEYVRYGGASAGGGGPLPPLLRPAHFSCMHRSAAAPKRKGGCKEAHEPQRCS